MLEVLRSGQLSLGPLLAEFERAFAARLGAAHASAVSSGTAGLHLALRAVGVTDGDEVITSPFSFVASANVGPVRAGAPGVRRHRPGDAQPRSRGRRGGGHRAHRRRCCPSTSSATRPTCRRSSGSGCRSSRTPARRWAPSMPTASPSGARGHPAVFGFYANKQLTTGEGGIVTTADAAIKERIDSERNQGRAPDMGWLDHDRLGFNYRLSDHRLRAGRGPARAARRDARRPSAGGRALPRGAGRHRGAGAALPRRRRQSPRLVRVRRPAPARASIATTPSGRWPSAASRASPTSRRST